MNDNKQLLNQIGNLLDTKLEPIKQDLGEVKSDLTGVKNELKGVKKDVAGVKRDLKGVKEDLKEVKQRLGTVELKVELVNETIKKSQEDTIEVLSKLIHTGYNLHEERIKKLEKRQHPSQPQ